MGSGYIDSDRNPLGCILGSEGESDDDGVPVRVSLSSGPTPDLYLHHLYRERKTNF